MGQKSDWWQEFFTSPWKYVQPLVRTPEQTEREADFIEDVLDLSPPSEILDIPCGEGRLSIELAARGYGATGVDLSDHFLENAQRQATTRGVDVLLHHGDMRSIPWESRYEAALCMWGSFGYFDAKGDSEFLHGVSRALRRRGRFLLDMHVAETLLPKYRENSWSRVGEFLVLEKRSFDHTTCRIEVDWTFVHDERRATHHSSIRIYTYREVVDLLKECRFGDFRAFGSLSKEPFGLGSPRCLLIAVKS